MKKLLFTLLAALAVISCSKDNGLPQYDAPQVTITIPSAVSGTNEATVPFGEEVVLTATTEATEVTSFLWQIDGKTVAQGKTATSYTFKATVPATYSVSVTAFNARSESSTALFKINSFYSFKKGTFVLSEGNMSELCGVLTFIDEKGTVTDSVFEKVNPGRHLGNTCQDLFTFNGKSYVISQNGNRSEGAGGYLVVAESESMKFVTEYTREEFSSLSWPTNVAVVSASKAYIRDNKGIQIADLDGHTLTGTVAGSSGAMKMKMISTNGKVYALASQKVLVIDPSSNAVTLSIALPGSASGMVLGRTGDLWVSCGGSPSRMVQISTATNTITQTNEVSSVSLSGGWSGLGLAAGTTEDALYFVKGTSVYKYDITANTATVLLDVKSAVTDANMVYGVPGVHPTSGALYLTTIKGYGTDYLTNSVNVISPTTGSVTGTYGNTVYFPAGVYFATE